jgi:hypothetical protein
MNDPLPACLGLATTVRPLVEAAAPSPARSLAPSPPLLLLSAQLALAAGSCCALPSPGALLNGQPPAELLLSPPPPLPASGSHRSGRYCSAASQFHLLVCRAWNGTQTVVPAAMW